MSVTSLDLYVPIQLDKPRKLKLTVDDMIALSAYAASRAP